MVLRRHIECVDNRRVGLDIGSSSVKGIEVMERASEIIVRSAGLVPLASHNSRQQVANTSATLSAIKTLWTKAAFDTNRVVIGLPPEAVYLKWLHLESSTDEELDRLARATATRGAPFDPADSIVQYRILSTRMSGTHNVHFVMLIAASASAIDSLLDLAERAGLEVLAVDIGAGAALRAAVTGLGTQRALWRGQPVAHCVLGASNTIIAVARDDQMEFARTVPIGGADFTECIAQAALLDWESADRGKKNPGTKLNEQGYLLFPHGNRELNISCVPVLDRLAREISRSIRFFSSQFAEGSYLGMIGAVTISGGGALLKGIDICLRQAGIDIRGIVNPFSGFPVDANTVGIHQVGDGAAAYTTAVGLAIGDYASATSKSCQSAA